jgi:hypothetical protein
VSQPVSSGDVLSAETLLLTVVSLFLTVWYSEIQKGLQLEIKAYKKDRADDQATARGLLWRRALPLALVAAASAAAFVPNSVQLLGHLKTHGRWQWPDYNVVSVSQVAVNVLLVAVALYAAGLTCLLAGKLVALRGPDKASPAAVA